MDAKAQISVELILIAGVLVAVIAFMATQINSTVETGVQKFETKANQIFEMELGK